MAGILPDAWEQSKIQGSLSGIGGLGGELSSSSESVGLEGELSSFGKHVSKYTGEYTVIPSAHSETVLNTNGLLMTDDVTVVEIPYYETSNVVGTTIYIANEV